MRRVKKTKAFTLVEMLIVVIIIGILSTAILPRLQNMITKIRDVKRVADLRNLETAITLYKDEHWWFPLPGPDPYNNAWSVSDLFPLLSPYLSSIPRDPSKNNIVNVMSEKPNNHRNHFKWRRIKYGEYFFQYGDWEYNMKEPHARFLLLIAKVETEEAANYIVFNHELTAATHYPGSAWFFYSTPGWVSQYNRVWDREWKKAKNFIGCDEIRKSDTPQIIDTEGKRICEYSSVDHLYHIVFIKE